MGNHHSDIDPNRNTASGPHFSVPVGWLTPNQELNEKFAVRAYLEEQKAQQDAQVAQEEDLGFTFKSGRTLQM